MVFGIFFSGLSLYINKLDYHEHINIISFGSPVLKP